MKRSLFLAVAGVAVVAINLPADAWAQTAVQPSRDRTRLQPARSSRRVQPARTTSNVERRVADRATTTTRTRTQPSVAYGGQRWVRTDRTLADEHIDARRERGAWALDRPRNRIPGRDRYLDRDWDRTDVRYRMPPVGMRSEWDRNRIYTWDNHRWHWNRGGWSIIGVGPDSYYYDYERAYPTYYTTSGSTVAAVQRELARKGYDPGPIDGVLGEQTRSAIAAFQRGNGLASTGRIDSRLLDELDLD